MVHVLTYNTHLFGRTIAGAFGQYHHDDERLDRIIENIRLQDFDIVCLCEVWKTSYKQKLIDRLDDVYGFHYHASSGGERIGDGLIVLSKFYLFDPVFERFKSLADTDAMSQKGVLSLCFHVDLHRTLRLFFTHTQAEDRESRVRWSNLKQIKNKVDSYHPGASALVLGDLNVPAVDDNGNSDEYDALLKLFPEFDDYWVLLHPGSPGHTCDPVRNGLAKKFKQTYSARYDYILGPSKDAKVSEVEVITEWRTVVNGAGEMDCSDHYPLRARLELGPETRTILPVYDSLAEAEAAARVLKGRYGDGISNLLVLTNESEYELELVQFRSWNGSFHQQPSIIVPPRKFAAGFHHHPDGESEQSAGGFVMLVRELDVTIFCGFIARWVPGLSKNKSYVEVQQGRQYFGINRKIDDNAASRIYRNLDNSDYEKYDKLVCGGILVEASAKTDKSSGLTSNSPFSRFVINARPA